MEGRFKPLRPRACDACRKRKIRCDGLETTGRICSHCASIGATCTFISMSKRRAPTKSYTESLETRLQMMQRLLEKHATHAQLEKELGFPLLPVDPGPSNLSRRSSDDSLSSPTSQPGKWDASDLIHVVDQIYDAESSGNSIDGSMLYNDIGETAQLAARLTDEPSTHYIGESSALKFLGILERIGKDCDANRVTKLRTSVPWSNESWFKSLFQYDNHRSQGAEYPGDDLVHLLIDLFFRHVNPVFPVIHEPTFRARISEYLHLRDERFGYLLLSVLTVASLYSTDERAFEEVDGIKIPGHRFFSQIKDWDKKLAPAVLTGLQAGFLLTLYRWARGQMHEAWISLGVGIRFAQDIGAHRQHKIKTESDSVEAEQWKRCFWCFVIFDRFVSSSLGQPLIVHEKDVDVEAPAPYPGSDDPRDRACVEFLKLTLRLGSHLTIALRSIYSVKPHGGTAFPESKIVEQLDSGLDRWLRSIPEDCRWNPDTIDLLALEHSGQLMCDYYYTAIMIHRPLVSRDPGHYPGLEICTSAAGACLRVLEVMAARLVFFSPHLSYTTWACGIVLLTKMWMLKQSDPPGNIESVRSDLRQCIKVLRTVAKKWNKTQRMIDILFELAQHGGIPLTYPKSSSRRQSPNAYASSDSSIKTASPYPTPSTPQSPPSQDTVSSPPLAPFPPSSALFPQPTRQHTVPPMASWVDPASVPLPEEVLGSNTSDHLNVPPARAYHPVQSMAHPAQPVTPFHPQLVPNFGTSSFEENLFGTWFQAPYADSRIQISEDQGWDAWSSFLAGVDVYAPSSTGSAYVAAPDFMDDVNVNRMLSFSDTPLHPGCGSASSMSSSPATSSRTHHQQTPLPHYDISVADNYMIMDRR